MKFRALCYSFILLIMVLTVDHYYGEAHAIESNTTINKQIVIGAVGGSEDFWATDNVFNEVAKVFANQTKSSIKLRFFINQDQLVDWLIRFRELDAAWIRKDNLSTFSQGVIIHFPENEKHSSTLSEYQLVSHQSVDPKIRKALENALLEIKPSTPDTEMQSKQNVNYSLTHHEEKVSKPIVQKVSSKQSVPTSGAPGVRQEIEKNGGDANTVMPGMTNNPNVLDEEKFEKPTKKRRVLSLQDAFVLVLENSRELEGERYKPLVALEDHNKSRAIYDPSLFMNASAVRTDRPTQSTLDGVAFDSALLEDRWQFQAGIKSRLPTGATLALYQEAGRVESSSNFVFPNPQYQSKIITTIKQPLLKGFGDQEGSTSIEVARLNKQIAESSLKRDVMGLLMEISKRYWQLYYEQNVVRINNDSLARAEQVYNREKIRGEQGLSKPVDVDRAIVAMKKRMSDLLRAKNQAYLSTRQLWQVMQPEYMFSLEIPEIVIKETPNTNVAVWPRKETLEIALNRRQELAIARDSVEIRHQEQSLASHNKLPILDLNLTYGFNGLDDSQDGIESDPYNDDYNNWQVDIAFEWPLGGRSPLAEKRKADYKLLQTKADMRMVAEQVSQDVDIVIDELMLAQEELDANREAMVAAQKVMDGEEALFELGQKNNQDLLTVQDFYGASERDYLRALVNYNINLVSLSRAQGTLIDDYGLEEKISTISPLGYEN